MRKLLLLVFLLSAVPAFGQTTANTHVSTGGTLPAVCRVGDVYYKTGTSSGLYNCSVANTWTVVSAGSVTTTGSPSSGQIAKFSGSTSITNATAATDFVAPGAVTTSGLTQATGTMLGRSTAATGAIEEITVGSGLTLSGGSLTAAGGGGTVTHTGTLTANELVVGNGSADVKTVGATEWSDPDWQNI